MIHNLNHIIILGWLYTPVRVYGEMAADCFPRLGVHSAGISHRVVILILWHVMPCLVHPSVFARLWRQEAEVSKTRFQII